jgi:hypothetical protein
MFGPMVVFVWRLVKTFRFLHIRYLFYLYGVVLRVVNLAYAWCHCERLVTLKELITPFTPHLLGGELHLFLWFNP